MPDVMPRITLYPATPDDTAQVGYVLARLLSAGDTVLLSGPVGSGKSHLARAIIQALLGRLEDVPSPTFTLVQTYGAGDTEIWHADLYRLSHPDEVAELGLEDAFGRAICLVEWPERLGRSSPESALDIRFRTWGEGRQITLTGSPDWANRLDQLAGVPNV